MRQTRTVIRTIEWRGDKAVFIDQTKLPASEEYVVCEDHRCVADAIRSMRIRGAPAIGVAAAFGMALAAHRTRARSTEQLLEELHEAADLLGSTRPTAVNLFKALERMERKAVANRHLSVSRLRRVLTEEAEAIAEEELEMSRRLGRLGASLLKDGDAVLTHCNAGALATVGYGTALAVVRAAVEEGKRISVFSDETRPLLQGARLTVWELMRDGIPVTLIVDGAAGHLMRTGRVSKVIVGADRIAANGDFANKIGTYGLAVMAKENSVPFYVAAPLTTIDLAVQSGEDIPIEERPADEVLRMGDQAIAPAGAAVLNPAFDVTPNHLVTAIITDAAIAVPPFDRSLASLF